MRYEHYWYPAQGKSSASRIAVLDCDGALGPAEGIAGMRRERMLRWSIDARSYRSGSVAIRGAHSGETVCGLWDRLAILTSSRDTTMLAVPVAARVLALIGFWTRLERGLVQLCGSGWDDESSPSGRSRHRDGLLLVDDASTVILCRIAGRAGKMLLVDLRNWGLDPLPYRGDCSQRVAYYASGISDMCRLIHDEDMGGLKATAGSQGVALVRRRPECVRLHCHAEYLALRMERAALYGGRCECYRIGRVPGPVYHLDVRSMYPAIASRVPLPVSLRAVHGTPPSRDQLADPARMAYMARVRVRAPLPAYPRRMRGQVMYPTGTITSVLCGPELAHALRAGGEVVGQRVYEYTLSDALSLPFAQLLTWTERARCNGQDMLTAWLKRVANSLVGKFAEQFRRWVPAGMDTEHGPYAVWTEHDEMGRSHRMRSIAWHTQRLEVDGESAWSVPAVTAWITAYGRMQLWRYIVSARRANVYYVDTDSLIVSQQGYDRLCDQGRVGTGEPGRLRLLGRHDECEIRGIRYYRLDGEVKCSGVPRADGVGLPDGAAIADLVGISESVRAARRPEAAYLRRAYLRVGEYRHGKVLPTNEVSPWEVDDD